MNKVYGIFGAVSGIVTSAFLYFYYQKELYTMRENNLLFRGFSVIILALCVIFAIIAAKKSMEIQSVLCGVCSQDLWFR